MSSGSPRDHTHALRTEEVDPGPVRDLEADKLEMDLHELLLRLLNHEPGYGRLSSERESCPTE